MTTLYADGGTIGGSPSSTGVYWSVGGDGLGGFWEDRSRRHRRSDEAEFLALFSALWLARVLPAEEAVLVRMDSFSVVHAVNAKVPPSATRTNRLYLAVQRALEGLRSRGTQVQLEWVPRSVIKKVLGH